MSDNGDLDVGPYWERSTADDLRSIAASMERYGAATIGDLREIWRTRGGVIESDDSALVGAAVGNELAGVPEVAEWLAIVVRPLARTLDDPEAEPYYPELAAELARALQSLHGEGTPSYRPRRLKLIETGDEPE